MEIPPLIRIQGVHGNSSVYHQNDGFFYHNTRRHGDNFYFRCSKVGSGCPATAVLNSEYFSSSQHNHHPDFQRLALQTERRRIVNEAANLQYATFNEIFWSTRNQFPNILTPHSLQPAMARARAQALPREPSNLHDLDNILKDERFKCITATVNFNDNIYSGSTLSEGSMVILLMSEKCKQFMKLSIALYTFTSLLTLNAAPHQYAVHVISTVWDGTTIILAWILMELLSVQSFNAGLTLLKSTIGRSHFQTVFCSYGSIEANAYQLVFPSVKVKVTLHHIVEAMVKFIHAGNLSHPNLLDFASLCCALPILPSDSFIIGLQVVRAEAARFVGLQEIAWRVLHFIESNFLSSAVGLNPSMSCDYYGTSNICETVQLKVLNSIETHRNSIYSLLRHIASSAETTKIDILDIECCRRRRRRYATSISNQQEILVLTRALTTSGNQFASARNLLHATSLKIKHLLS